LLVTFGKLFSVLFLLFLTLNISAYAKSGELIGNGFRIKLSPPFWLPTDDIFGMNNTGGFIRDFTGWEFVANGVNDTLHIKLDDRNNTIKGTVLNQTINGNFDNITGKITMTTFDNGSRPTATFEGFLSDEVILDLGLGDEIVRRFTLAGVYHESEVQVSSSHGWYAISQYYCAPAC
jgi:hypothetical protein